MNKAFKSFLFVTAMSVCGVQFAADAQEAAAVSTVEQAVVNATEQNSGIGATVVNVVKAPFRFADNSVNYVVNTLGVKGALVVAFVAGVLAKPCVDFVNEMLEEDFLA